jgi:hypothetical protein
MGCHSIADVLRGLGVTPPSESERSNSKLQDIEVADNPPVRVVRGYGERSTVQTNWNRERSCERSRMKRALARLADAPVSSEITASVAEPLSPACEPWLRFRVDASLAKDVIERSDDDRSRAWRRELYARTLGAAKPVRPVKFNFGAQAKVKTAPKPKVKKERTPELREYFRNYGRMWRAKKKAEGIATTICP